MDMDTFLTALYVVADDFSKTQLSPRVKTGPEPSLSSGEVIALSVLGQWQGFGSERGFYRFAVRNLRKAFPRLPDRSQFNRLMRDHAPGIAAFGVHMVELLDARNCAYEAVDTSGVPVRNSKRGGPGWLEGTADIGWCNVRHWIEGFRIIASVNPDGVITGFGFGPASAKDQPMAEELFAARKAQTSLLPSAGKPALGHYVVDKGFQGVLNHQRWSLLYGAQVVCAPRRDSKDAWSTDMLRWLSGIRQIVETVFDKLKHTFRLDRERPHCLIGFAARLAAKVALHNFCIWINDKLGRPKLAFADLISW